MTLALNIRNVGPARHRKLQIRMKGMMVGHHISKSSILGGYQEEDVESARSRKTGDRHK